MYIVNLREFWKTALPENKRAAAVMRQVPYFLKTRLEILLSFDVYYTDLPMPLIAVIFF